MDKFGPPASTLGEQDGGNGQVSSLPPNLKLLDQEQRLAENRGVPLHKRCTMKPEYMTETTEETGNTQTMNAFSNNVGSPLSTRVIPD